ncbi:melatonin receptor type 1B-A-like [Nematostella vectensis]|uniref:melatonin receptor type 1B-A-like n=1 Tax=Nematostella vectensis TaxID=45351 RepID=UPI002076DF46|nr:melatonin receptor type 1B-A-like [Nematostella vectensis]
MQLVLSSRGAGLVVAEAGLFTILWIAMLIGNGVTVYIVLRNPRLRTVPNLFVVSLALSDIGLGVLSMPLCTSVLVTSRWLFGHVSCQYQGFVAGMMALTSTQTLALTSVNRYFRMVKPNVVPHVLHHAIHHHPYKLFLVISILAPVPYLASGSLMVFHPGKFYCYLHINAGWYLAFVGTFFVGIPNSIIMFCYYKIFITVRAHENRVQKHEK